MKGAIPGGQRRGLTPLWLMVVVFAAPVVAAWFFYLNPEYLPAGRSNKGELIEPVVHLPPGLGLFTPQGAELGPGALAGRWTLVYLAGGDCTDACRNQLIAIRQIRLALGENQLSTGRLLILTDPAAADLGAELEREFEGMQVAVTDAASGERLLELLGQGAQSLDRIHILDPMGNLMMRYAPDAPPEDTLKDMERLLKASKNWIKGSNYGHK